jgi:hypothetical protein
MQTIRTEQIGKATVRLVRMEGGFAAVAFEGDKRIGPFEDEDPDAAWSFVVRELGKISPSYFGFDGAKARFLRLFPQGFLGSPFETSERAYKESARQLLIDTMPVEQASQASAGDWEIIARVFSKTNMLSQFEQARTRDVLKGQKGAAFIRASAALAGGDLGALSIIADAFRDYGQFSWPAATYLAYFWRPDTHMFLKPQVTKDFAERVGHPFASAYSAQPDPKVYEALLSLVSETREELVTLGPRDNIDIQSFIWVVGAYEGEVAVQ